ncbi:hypothetical protein T4E_10095 [Trichinella pseudospiralis]|uniref:Uncharacterized protein n=1 Tax=Trichinella pseudospiralis TaxID=6337 RepID=A0A0V0XNB0_TRIPS|nr:hypothetical protein T4E_10095 [Trichinella pseudospiralis]
MPNLKTIYCTIAGLFGSTVIHEFEDMVIKKSPNFGEQCFAIFRRTAEFIEVLKIYPNDS